MGTANINIVQQVRHLAVSACGQRPGASVGPTFAPAKLFKEIAYGDQEMRLQTQVSGRTARRREQGAQPHQEERIAMYCLRADTGESRQVAVWGCSSVVESGAFQSAKVAGSIPASPNDPDSGLSASFSPFASGRGLTKVAAEPAWLICGPTFAVHFSTPFSRQQRFAPAMYPDSPAGVGERSLPTNRKDEAICSVT